jgi:hypothetical protein
MKQTPKPVVTWSPLLGIVQAVLLGGGSGLVVRLAVVWLPKLAPRVPDKKQTNNQHVYHVSESTLLFAS